MIKKDSLAEKITIETIEMANGDLAVAQDALLQATTHIMARSVRGQPDAATKTINYMQLFASAFSDALDER